MNKNNSYNTMNEINQLIVNSNKSNPLLQRKKRTVRNIFEEE